MVCQDLEVLNVESLSDVRPSRHNQDCPDFWIYLQENRPGKEGHQSVPSYHLFLWHC